MGIRLPVIDPPGWVLSQHREVSDTNVMKRCGKSDHNRPSSFQRRIGTTRHTTNVSPMLKLLETIRMPPMCQKRSPIFASHLEPSSSDAQHADVVLESFGPSRSASELDPQMRIGSWSKVPHEKCFAVR